jgi:hypothetical protein
MPLNFVTDTDRLVLAVTTWRVSICETGNTDLPIKILNIC